MAKSELFCMEELGEQGVLLIFCPMVHTAPVSPLYITIVFISSEYEIHMCVTLVGCI